MKYAQVGWSFGFHVGRVSLYYLQRAVTLPALRAGAIRVLQHIVGGRPQLEAAAGPAAQALFNLRHDGIASLGRLLSEQQCEDIHVFLADKPLTHKSHPGAQFSIDARPDSFALGDHALAHLADCPHILATANHPDLLHLARQYLGCTPTLSGVSARWSFPSTESREVVQQFHRDAEDWKAFRVMIYLTDVDDSSGPHVYVKASHLHRRTRRLPVLSDAAVAAAFGARRIVRHTGPRGSTFAVDTAGLHKGQAPRARPRLMLSFQYSILPCYLYEYEPLPFREHPYDRYVNRLIIERRRR